MDSRRRSDPSRRGPPPCRRSARRARRSAARSPAAPPPRRSRPVPGRPRGSARTVPCGRRSARESPRTPRSRRRTRSPRRSAAGSRGRPRSCTARPPGGRTRPAAFPRGRDPRGPHCRRTRRDGSGRHRWRRDSGSGATGSPSGPRAGRSAVRPVGCRPAGPRSARRGPGRGSARATGAWRSGADVGPTPSRSPPRAFCPRWVAAPPLSARDGPASSASGAPLGPVAREEATG